MNHYYKMFKKRKLNKQYKSANIAQKLEDGITNDSDNYDDNNNDDAAAAAAAATVVVPKLVATTSRQKKSEPQTAAAAAAAAATPMSDSSSKKALLSNTAKAEATKEDRLAAEFNEEKRSKDDIEGTAAGTPTLDSTSYKGQQNYATFIKKSEYAATKSSNLGKPGPVKTASNIRSTTVIDFQPDVCKDYQQHGYCGYGDTCKFLHIRDEFKKTRKIDKEWEMVGQRDKKKKKVVGKQSKIEKLI